METDFYYTIYHPDRRKENYHVCALNETGIDTVLDMMCEFTKKGYYILAINEQVFRAKQPYIQKVVGIHLDLNEPFDAKGEKVAYMEKYEL